MKRTHSNWKISIKNAKIVFLDKDGVLNSQAFYTERQKLIGAGKWKFDRDLDDFCPESIRLLNELTATTGAKIVLSAAMRYDGSIRKLQNLFIRAGIKGTIVGRTPYLHSGRTPNFGAYNQNSTPRGCEIKWWLAEQGFHRITWGAEEQAKILKKSLVSNYVILDDDPDMLYEQREHFVKTNAYKNGFNEQCLKRATAILSTSALEIYSKTQDV